MSTSQKRAANRRNAQHSTGPKSKVGKRVASLNAVRHGLNARSSLNSLSPALSDLQQLIQEEVGDEIQARLIAGKILDYERTEAALYQVAVKEAAGKDGYLDEEALQKKQLEGAATAVWSGQMEADLKQKGLSKHKREELMVYRDSLKFLTRVSARQAQQILNTAADEAVRLRRYYKRASNQLIKAIKHVARIV